MRHVKISGLGVPAEMVEYTLNGCAPEFALWSFVDLGYLTYYVSYLLATGAIQGVEGEIFTAGRIAATTYHHRRPDPAGHQGAARPDGPLHGLQRGERRGCGQGRAAVRQRSAAPRAPTSGALLSGPRPPCAGSIDR